MATQTFAVGVLKHLESTFFAPLEKENAKLSELRKVLVSLLQFFSDPNLGYRRLLCLDVVANFPRDETGNQWQHIIEQVLFALTKEVEQLGKKKARVHLPSFNIFHKILHLCEERNPGYFLERIAKKLFDHVHFALSRCLCTESKYVEIVTVYERILTLLMKSPLYCKAFKWDLLKKFILFCFGDDGRVDQMTTDLLRIVVTSFTYDYEAKNMFGDTEEYDGDLNSIFYQISFAFKSIILPGRTSGESADTIADIAKNLLCVLNVLMEKCGLNVVSALYRWGHTSFQYALASMTDSLPVLRDESLRYLQNHMRLLRENTKWYGLTNMKKYSITENISNMYEVLVETNILTKFLSQAGSPHVMDGSGKIEFDRATTSSTPLERHARLAADIFFCIDLTSKEVPDGIADKDDWVERYCRVAGGSPLESEGKTDSSGSGDFLSPNLRRKRGASSPSLITAAGYASSAGRDLLCLTVAHGLRTGYIEPKNHDVVWQLPFEKGIFHNIHALAMVFASLSCPNFSTSVDPMVRVKLLKYVLSCAEVLLLGENCDGTQEREEIAPENVQYTYFVAAVMCSLFSSDCSVVNLATISDREEEEINIDKEKIVNGAAHDVHIETKVSVDKIIFDVTQSWWTKTGGLSAAYSSAESSIKMQQEMHRTIFSWLTVHLPEETLASHEHSKLIKCICASYFGAAWLQTAFSIPACAHLITAEYVDVVAKLVHVVVCAINSGCLSVDVFIQHRANILHKVAANVIEALCVRLGRLGNACAIAKCFQDIKQELLIALSHDVKQTALRYRDFQTSVKTYFAYCSDLSSTSSVDQPKHDDDDFRVESASSSVHDSQIYQTILTDVAEAFVLGRKKSLVYINDNNSRVFFWTVLEIFKCLNITVHEARCNVLFRSLVDIISTMNLVHSSRDSVHSPKLLPRDVRLTSQFFCAQLLELRADCNEDLFEAIMAQVEDWLQDEDYYVRCASGETYSLLLNGRSIDDKIVIYEDYESKFRLSSGSPKLEFQTYVLGSLSIGMKCNELIPRVLSSLVDFCADNEWGKHLGIYCLTVLARSCLKEEIEFRAPYALLTEHMRFVLGTWVRADFQRPVSELRRFPFSVFYPSHVFNSIESFIRRFMHFVVAEIVVQGSATQADTREGIHSSLETLSSKRLMLLSSLEEFVEPTNWKGTSGLLRQYFGSIYAFSRSFTYLPDPSIEDDGDSIERIKPGEIANYVDKFLLGALEKKIYYTYAFMNRCEIVPWLLLLDPSVVASPVNLDDYGEQNPPKLIRDAKQYIFDKIKSNPEGGGPVLLKVVSSIDVLAFLYTFATCSHDLRTFSLVSKALRVYVNCSSPEVLDDLFITLILSLAWFLCDKSASCWFDCCCIVSRYIEKHLVSRAPEGKIFLEKKMNLFMRIMLLPFLCPREVILKQIDLREYTQVKNMASKGMNSLFASRRRGSLRDAIRRIPDLPKIEELQALVSRKSQERSTLTNTIRYFMTSVNDVFFNIGLGVYYSHYVLSNISDFAETSLSTLSAEAVNTSSCCFEDDIVAARVDMDTNILTPYSGRDNQVGNTDSGLVSRFTEAVIEICNCPSVSPSIHKIASACLGVLEQGGGGWYASHGLVARSKILAKCLVDRVKQSSCRGSAFAACFSGKRDLEITEKTSRGNLSITLREIVRDDFQEAKRTFELGEHLWHCGDTPFPVFVTRLAYMCVTQYIPEDSFRNCAAACLLDPCFAEAIFHLHLEADDSFILK
eukprot:Stramenopile-MAST_4_protein_246